MSGTFKRVVIAITVANAVALAPVCRRSVIEALRQRLAVLAGGAAACDGSSTPAR